MYSLKPRTDVAKFRKLLLSSATIQNIIKSFPKGFQFYNSHGMLCINIVTTPEDINYLTTSPQALYLSIMIYAHCSLPNNSYFVISDDRDGIIDQIKSTTNSLVCSPQTILSGTHPANIGGIKCYMKDVSYMIINQDIYLPIRLENSLASEPVTISDYRDGIFGPDVSPPYEQVILSKLKTLIKRPTFTSDKCLEFVCGLVRVQPSKSRDNKLKTVLETPCAWRDTNHDVIIGCNIVRYGNVDLINLVISQISIYRKGASHSVLRQMLCTAVMYDKVDAFMAILNYVNSSIFNEELFIYTIRFNSLVSLSIFIRMGANIKPYLQKGIKEAQSYGNYDMKELLERVSKSYMMLEASEL